MLGVQGPVKQKQNERKTDKTKLVLDCTKNKMLPPFQSAMFCFLFKDQKILDLLERKYKDDKLLEETRQEVRLAWDEQRQLEERSKVNNEMLRRKNLADSNWIRQKKKVS